MHVDGFESRRAGQGMLIFVAGDEEVGPGEPGHGHLHHVAGSHEHATAELGGKLPAFAQFVPPVNDAGIEVAKLDFFFQRGNQTVRFGFGENGIVLCGGRPGFSTRKLVSPWSVTRTD